ncbi:hypothetical protein DRJ00_03385, partial [Candidatus Aerophobetes bacterium]
SGWSETYTGSDVYMYTGTGTLVVLDGNGATSGTAGQVGIDDGGTEADATAGDDIIEGSEWRPYPSNGIIYSPGNLRVLGMIGDDNGTPSNPDDDTSYNLTIVSGGTIYIEGNLLRGTAGSSLALLAKDWVVLNPTHIFTGGYFTGTLEFETYGEEGEVRWKFMDNLIGEEDNLQAMYQVKEGGIITLMVLDFQRMMTFNTLTFMKLHLNEHWLLSVWGSNNSEFSTDGDILLGEVTTPVLEQDVDFVSENPITCRFVKIYLEDQRENPGEGWEAPFKIDAIKVLLKGGAGGDGTWNGEPVVSGLFYAQEKSWAVIPGNFPDKDKDYPIVIGGCIAENEQEQSEKWSDWSDISYIYEDLATPPYLPPSVNLVTLRRK